MIKHDARKNVVIELTFEQVYYDQLWAAAKGNSVQFLIKEIVDDYLKELNMHIVGGKNE